MPSIPAEWQPLLSLSHLMRVFGADVVHRGLRYADDGRVRGVRIVERGVVQAEVVGTRLWPYQVLLEPVDPIGGFCTCPVEQDCKHVVALAVELSRMARTEHDWEHRLDHALPEPDRAQVPLGLQLELADGLDPERPRVTFRPVRPGKRGGWVRTGISWAELQYGHHGPYADHPGRSLLAALREMPRSTPSGQLTAGWGDAGLDLADLGPALWPMLSRLTEAGVVLVHERNGTVRVGPPVAAEVDVSRGDRDQLELRVCYQPSAPGEPELTDPWRLGDPAFGVMQLDGDELGLWPLDPLPDRTVAALLGGPPIVVPAAGEQRFRSRYLPRLRRASRVISRDESVALPPELPPQLVARVSHLPGHVTELDLAYHYRPDGADGPTVEVPVGDDAGIHDGDDGFVVRDRAAEDTLLSEHLGETPFFGEPRSHHRFTGRDTVRFVTDLLPGLRDDDRVQLTSEGEPVDYELAAEEPVIALEVDDTDADWFDLSITVTLDGRPVPLIPLIRGLAVGDPLLILDDGLVIDLTREEFGRLRELLVAARALGDPEQGPLQLRPEHVAVWEQLQGYGIVGAQADRWRELASTALTTVSDDGAEAELPAGLQAELRPYQRAGFGWLDRLWRCGLGGVLADDMGLGKTIQVLAAVLAAKARAGADARPVLVVAPTSVVPNWVSEAARFTPDLTVTAVTATQRRRRSTLTEAIADADVVVTTYALLRLEVDDYAQVSWAGVVLDEAQQVKNHRGKGYRAVRLLEADVRFVVTGTPLENNLMELWTMLSIAAPGLFPDPEVFATDFKVPIDKGNTEVLALLRRRIRPLMLRRTKQLVAADLPAKQEQLLSVRLAPEHRRRYDTRLARERQRVLGLLTDLDAHRFEVLQALTALRQLALAPALVPELDRLEPAGDAATETHTGPVAKIETLTELLDEIAAEGHRALVFSQFTRFLDLIEQRLDRAGLAHTRLDGSMSLPQRDRALERFRDGAAEVFLISLKAGGFGLNLTEADYVFVMDPWWNPAAEKQAIDRTHRIGQTRPVHVYRMIAADTIEEKVAALQQRKRELFSRVIDAEAGLADSRLTADDLRELFE